MGEPGQRNTRPTRAGKLLFPVLPGGRALPWVLAALSAGLIGWGALASDSSMLIVGIGGLVGVAVAFPMARLLLGRHGDGEDETR